MGNLAMLGLLLADSIYRGRVCAQTLLGIFINHVMVCVGLSPKPMKLIRRLIDSGMVHHNRN
jgi:hypothetical protein